MQKKEKPTRFRSVRREAAPPLKIDVVCMKMNKIKKALLQFLPALAFATAALAAVHMLSFVWLVGFVYRDNIRGDVPAGLTGLTILGIAWVALLFLLSAVAERRRNRFAPYFLSGCLAGPAAVFGFSIYTSLLIPFLGKYSWQKDVTMGSVGGAVCTVMAIVFYRFWLSKRADNKQMQAIAGKPGSA